MHYEREHYDTIEVQCVATNPNITMSKWEEWWYDDRGRRILPNRWRLWQLWLQHSFGEHAPRFRQMPWALGILQCIVCQPSRFDVFIPAPSSRSQSR